MKKWRYLVYLGIAVLSGWLIWEYREELGLTGPHGLGTSTASAAPVTEPAAPKPARIDWQPVDRSRDGFRVEMPADVKQITVPAYGETGSTESVNMIYANPDGGTAFSVAWADSPPVVRVTNRQPERTLEAARDGALARTQTTLISENPSNLGGNPTRDIVARNSGGGVMDSRLIVAGNRLYMLTAVFPSMGARREQDVTRFYNSFVATAGTNIPQSLPEASQPALHN